MQIPCAVVRPKNNYRPNSLFHSAHKEDIMLVHMLLAVKPFGFSLENTIVYSGSLEKNTAVSYPLGMLLNWMHVATMRSTVLPTPEPE
ncbi:hypothetical protein FRX31_024720 [Thalictrum thalictroides]|uniref:Uncharacterized protein n=1 Tax=Thalictrum thalictroides TaxID=46969 RepID=A0A7J6VNF4_THATH|nr:hypothetical protein FRX31_024720 [Thalictrum thalictroides]